MTSRLTCARRLCALSAAALETLESRRLLATVTVTSTADTAAAGSDYTAKSGSVTFNAGDTSKTITIAVAGDTDDESDETFFVNLTADSLGGGSFDDAQGLGTGFRHPTGSRL